MPCADDSSACIPYFARVDSTPRDHSRVVDLVCRLRARARVIARPQPSIHFRLSAIDSVRGRKVNSRDESVIFQVEKFSSETEIRTADLPDAGRGLTHATTASPIRMFSFLKD